MYSSSETGSKTSSSSSLLNFAALSILFSGVLYIGIISSFPSSTPLLIFPTTKTSINGHLINSSTVGGPDSSNATAPDELEVALSRAAMANKTLIITVVNRAYAEQGIETERTMLDIFVDSFWLGEGTRSLLDHVLVVTMDLPSYRRCKFRRLNCYRLVTEGVDFGGEKLYMSKEFVAMMWRRTLFLADVLRRGYNFIFTDTDIVWLRNPFDQLSKNQTEDLQLSTDWFNGNPWSEKNYMNTGFYFVRSNNKTVSLFDTWYAQKDNATGKKEQDVLLDLVHEGGIFTKLGLRVRFLDTVYFSGFCTDSTNFTAVTTVHANCCRSIKAKVHDLTAVFHDWKRYQWTSRRLRTGGRNGTADYKWTKHVGCVNSWGPKKTDPATVTTAPKS